MALRGVKPPWLLLGLLICWYPSFRNRLDSRSRGWGERDFHCWLSRAQLYLRINLSLSRSQRGYSLPLLLDFLVYLIEPAALFFHPSNLIQELGPGGLNFCCTEGGVRG